MIVVTIIVTAAAVEDKKKHLFSVPKKMKTNYRSVAIEQINSINQELSIIIIKKQLKCSQYYIYSLPPLLISRFRGRFAAPVLLHRRRPIIPVEAAASIEIDLHLQSCYLKQQQKHQQIIEKLQRNLIN